MRKLYTLILVSAITTWSYAAAIGGEGLTGAACTAASNVNFAEMLAESAPFGSEDGTVSIFPNPVVNGSVNLDLNFAQPTDATITIADMSGRVISVRDRMGVTQEKVNFNLPQLATGTYIARIATKEGTLTKKFVVQQ